MGCTVAHLEGAVQLVHLHLPRSIRASTGHQSSSAGRLLPAENLLKRRNQTRMSGSKTRAELYRRARPQRLDLSPGVPEEFRAKRVDVHPIALIMQMSITSAIVRQGQDIHSRRGATR